METTIQVNLDQACKQCGQMGATQSGYCMECISKQMEAPKGVSGKIEIATATVKSVKADFIQSTVTVSLVFALNAEALAIREQLAMMGFMKDPTRVTIERTQKQLTLF